MGGLLTVSASNGMSTSSHLGLAGPSEFSIRGVVVGLNWTIRCLGDCGMVLVVLLFKDFGGKEGRGCLSLGCGRRYK